MKSVRAVDRAIEILQSFTPEQPSMTVPEIEKRVKLARPTLYRLLYTLELKGLVRSRGEPLRYELDLGLAMLGHTWFAQVDINRIAAATIEQLHREFNETIALYLRRGPNRVCVRELPSRQPIAFSRGIGHVDSLAVGASGKAILCRLPDAEREAMIAAALPIAAQRDKLTLELQQALSKGYTVSRSEVTLGAVGISAAFTDHTGSVVGSVAIFGPDVRMTEATILQYGPEVAKAAAEISRLLGTPG